ncbi:MAG: SDR family NAD(P)-dependent oxidoreductase, partial [Erythrobacter sp.]|nr:SDR family NAD(P)-dependent oxidoreductase [Erythrobacter sp.]
MSRLNGAICVVTGGARGIGRAICAAFHEADGKVLLTDIDDEEGRAAAAAIGCDYLHLDVREEADWEAL